MIIEGYAALFGVADLAGDIIRAGAFRASLLARQGALPMLVEHETRALAGKWTDVREDGRGLFVSGEIDDAMPGAARARKLIGAGFDGLSIGFVAIAAHGPPGARVLEDIDLIEVSLVSEPMQPLARFSVIADAGLMAASARFARSSAEPVRGIVRAF